MTDSRTKTTTRRWRQWRETEARKVLAEWARAGTSLDAFARTKGVSPSRLRYWRARLGEAAAVHFVPVVVPAGPPPLLEVTVRGVVVRLREDLAAQYLARVVAALAAVLPPC